MNWERARKIEQIDQRREQILSAALGLFTQEDYKSVSLNNIAREAGMAKSNIYRYFKTKEEIFLNIYQTYFSGWINDLIETLSDGMPMTVEELSVKWVDSMIRHREMLELNTVLSSALEQNSSEDSLAEFKRFIIKSADNLAKVLWQWQPGFTEEKSTELLFYVQILSAGILKGCKPSPTMENVLLLPEFAALCVDPHERMIRILSVLLSHYEKELKS